MHVDATHNVYDDRPLCIAANSAQLLQFCSPMPTGNEGTNELMCVAISCRFYAVLWSEAHSIVSLQADLQTGTSYTPCCLSGAQLLLAAFSRLSTDDLIGLQCKQCKETRRKMLINFPKHLLFYCCKLSRIWWHRLVSRVGAAGALWVHCGCTVGASSSKVHVPSVLMSRAAAPCFNKHIIAAPRQLTHSEQNLDDVCTIGACGSTYFISSTEAQLHTASLLPGSHKQSILPPILVAC